jgi:hypothetical protein
VYNIKIDVEDKVFRVWTGIVWLTQVSRGVLF